MPRKHSITADEALARWAADRATTQRWTEADAPEIGANALRKGDVYMEPGMDPVRVRSRRDHGDTVLVTGTKGEKFGLDIDTVVLLLERKTT